MSPSIALANGAMVLVADARKALFLINKGDEAFLNLQVARALEADPNPRTSDQGADRPGGSHFGGRRSKFEQTDWHQANEDAFADSVIGALSTFHDVRQLVIVAPPKFLARMRQHLPGQGGPRKIAEIAKDYTHLTVSEIEKKLLH
jgi:protein required for attachment to host cells